MSQPPKDTQIDSSQKPDVSRPVQELPHRSQAAVPPSLGLCHFGKGSAGQGAGQQVGNSSCPLAPAALASVVTPVTLQAVGEPHC